MKIVTIAAAALLLGMMPVMAEDVNPDVDTQIEEIIQAPSQERHRLMNRFKKQLSQMNEEERAAAIAKLQERTMTRDQTQDQTQDQTRDRIRTQDRLHDGEGDMVRTQTRTQQQMDQMQQTQQMNRMQQMNQMQGAMKQSQGGMKPRGQ